MGRGKFEDLAGGWGWSGATHKVFVALLVFTLFKANSSMCMSNMQKYFERYKTAKTHVNEKLLCLCMFRQLVIRKWDDDSHEYTREGKFTKPIRDETLYAWF